MVWLEQEMDGEALMAAFATCSRPDCIKDIIKAFGTRLKVYNVIKTAIGETYQQNVSMQYRGMECLTSHTSLLLHIGASSSISSIF